MIQTIKDNRYNVSFTNIHGIIESWCVTNESINNAKADIARKGGTITEIQKVPFQG